MCQLQTENQPAGKEMQISSMATFKNIQSSKVLVGCYNLPLQYFALRQEDNWTAGSADALLISLSPKRETNKVIQQVGSRGEE